MPDEEEWALPAPLASSARICASGCSPKASRSSASTTCRTARWRTSARCSTTRGSASRCWTARAAASCARRSTAATRSPTWRRRRSRASAGPSRRSRSTSPASTRPPRWRCRSDADLIVTSTSDVYGNATPPFAEDDRVVLGPSTTQALGVRGLEALRRALRARHGRGEGPAGHDPAPVQRLRAEEPPQLVGRPGRDVRRGAARRPADGDPRRRSADAHVHVRRRHRRRLRAGAAHARRRAARSSTWAAPRR